MTLALAAVLLAGCSDEGDKTYPTTERPEWTAVAEDAVTAAPGDWTVPAGAETASPAWAIDNTGTDAAPAWTAPDNAENPVSMTAVVGLSPYLARYYQSGDRVAAFIGGTCRGISTVIESGGKPLFYIMVKARETESGNVEFRYYSTGQKRLYVAPTTVAFATNKVYGSTGAPQYPDFEQGGKYPLAMSATVKVNVAAGTGDKLGVLVGDECRGVASYDGSGTYKLEIRGKAAGESMELKYYDAANKRMLRTSTRITMADGGTFGTAAAPQEVTFEPENYMKAFVSLPAELQPYSGTGDRLAAFISGKCCGVGTATGVGTYRIDLTAAAGESGKITFKYYCAKLGYLFTAADATSFADAGSFGSETALQTLAFDLGGKHPLTMSVVCTLPAELVPSASGSDLIAAFVGSECRGVGTYEELANGTKEFKITVRGSLGNNERVSLRYYCGKTSYLYDTGAVYGFTSGSYIGTLDSPTTLKLTVAE